MLFSQAFRNQRFKNPEIGELLSIAEELFVNTDGSVDDCFDRAMLLLLVRALRERR